MDPKLEAHIDEIFQDVPKTEKLVTMINSIKSKANTKYLDTIEQGYARKVALNQVDDWLMEAKVIVNEEVGKLSPANVSDLPSATRGTPGTVVSSAAIEGADNPAMVLERGNVFGDQNSGDAYAEMFYDGDESAGLSADGDEKSGKKSKKRRHRAGREDEEEEIEVEVPHTGLTGKLIGSFLLLGGVALIVVAILILGGIISF